MINIFLFTFLSCSLVFFYVFCIEIPVNVRCRPYQMPRFTEFDLNIYCLHICMYQGYKGSLSQH